MAVTSIVAYDIVADSRRSKVAAVLQAYGDRVQRSVFVLWLEQEDLEKVLERIAGLVDPNVDSVVAWRQCAECWTAAHRIGQAEPPERELYWEVL
jgi:CRISPR-associated protein Cas2